MGDGNINSPIMLIGEAPGEACLLYTSDAADEEDSVDLGGRRIIKKKNEIKHSQLRTAHL